MYKNQCRHIWDIFLDDFFTESNAGIYGTSFWMIFLQNQMQAYMGHLFGWFITESNAGIWDIFLDDLLLSPLPAWKLFHGRAPYNPWIFILEKRALVSCFTCLVLAPYFWESPYRGDLSSTKNTENKKYSSLKSRLGRHCKERKFSKFWFG
jgi:hypothetical protein